MTVTALPSPQPNDSGGVPNYASGQLVTDSSTAAAYVLALGFTPRKFRILDITSSAGLTIYEQVDQMPAANTIKTVGATGVSTIDTTGLITIGTNAAGTDRTVTLSATLMAASHVFAWEAFA